MKRLSCTLLLLAACGSPKSSLPLQESPVVVVPSATSPTVEASAEAPKKSVKPPETTETEPQVDCSDAAFIAAEKALEAAIARNNVADIVKHFDQALYIHTRDVALRNRYMKFLVDQGLDASEQAQILLAIGDDNNAQAWTVLGLQAESEQKNEQSRAYFARAAAIDPKSKGAARLGNQSRCTGAFSRANADSPALDITTGWLGLFRIIEDQRMVHEEKPDPTNEAAARKRVCVDNDLTEIIARDVCHGNGPWKVQTGHMHFHDNVVIIVPLPKNRFAVVPYYTGTGCRGGSEAKAAVFGNIIQVQTTSLESIVNPASPCDEGPHDSLTDPCITGTNFESAYYDAATGKHLASVTEASSHEKHVLKGGKLTRSEGASCNETVDLRTNAGGK